MLAGLRGRLPQAEVIAQSGDRILGFSLGRDGRMIPHVGPLVAESDGIACAILAHAIERIDAPLFIDLADAKSQVREFLQARGFAAVRPFTRMAHGQATRFDDPERTFAVIGPSSDSIDVRVGTFRVGKSPDASAKDALCESDFAHAETMRGHARASVGNTGI